MSNSRYSKKTYRFHNALKKYGADAFTWEILEYTDSLDKLNELEDKYIKLYDSIKNGFNLRKGGNNKLHAEESKKRMSQAQKEAHARRRKAGSDGGWKRADGGAMKGKSHSKESIEKIKEANKKTAAEKKARGELNHWQINKSPLKNKTWKLIDGKRVWFEKEITE